MAFRLLRVYSLLGKPMQQTFLSTNCSVNHVKNINQTILKTQIPSTQLVRSTSFFVKRPAETLWKSVMSVSNAGKNRGRAKGNKGKFRNLNRGQMIGVGKINMLWPGLTGPIMRGNLVVKQQKLPEDPEREAKLIKLRQSNTFSRKVKRLHPLERGWTGAKLGGLSIGPPDPVNDDTFDGFDTKVLEHKIVHHMTGNLGRKRTVSAFVITGNKNGLCGIALGKANDTKASLKLAKNRAGSKLMYVPRLNNHTVYHDFFSQFGNTKLFVTKKPAGYGLVCHRAIKSACEMIGIKDLHVKVEGAINYQSIIKAFLVGLLKQRTHEQLAEEKRLHLVEISKENSYYPKVVASPSVIRSPKEIPSTEIRNLKDYVLDGKVILKKKKYVPPFVNLPSYQLKQRKMEYLRNQDEVKIRLLAEYGELRSFLTDKYPEARPQIWDKNRVKED